MFHFLFVEYFPILQSQTVNTFFHTKFRISILFSCAIIICTLLKYANCFLFVFFLNIYFSLFYLLPKAIQMLLLCILYLVEIPCRPWQVGEQKFIVFKLYYTIIVLNLALVFFFLVRLLLCLCFAFFFFFFFSFGCWWLLHKIKVNEKRAGRAQSQRTITIEMANAP